MKQDIAILFLSIGTVTGLAALGVTASLGAHPVAWPVQVALIGAPIGAVLAALTGRTAMSKWVWAAAYALFAGVAWGAAHYGKTAFVASYAEDQFAGQMWYFGWIVACAMAAAFLTAIGARNG